MAMPGGGLPMPAQGQGLPMAMPGGALPMSAQAQGFPMAVEAGLPSRSNAFDDSDRAVPGQMDGLAVPFGSVGIDLDGPARPLVGDEADLASQPAPAAEGAQPSQRRARPSAPPAKKSNARKIGVFVTVAAALTGGAFSLVPSIGPFGMYFVSDRLNAGANAAALDELRKSVDGQLDEDTHDAISGAIERCKAGRAPMRRYQPAAAFCAYVALERGLRFGRRSEDEALAKQLLADSGDSGGSFAVLATAALDVLAGQAAKARGPVGTLVQKSPQELDFAVVAGDVELTDKATAKAAVTAWTAAMGIKKSARTLFGLARSLAAAGDAKGAEATARAVLAASPSHAGARMLIASTIWSDPGREAEALNLLKQVTDAGAVSKAASEGEMVDAFTLVGNIHLARSRMSAAEPAFAAALKINPLAVKALVGNGELFYRSARYSEALSRFEAATNADAESIVAKVGIAKTYISLERMKEAKDMLKKLREARPGEPLVSLWLGHAEEALNNKKEAEAAYVEAIKIGQNRPEVVDAYVALARLLSGVGRNDDANAKLAEAAKKFPDLPALHRARGEVALQMGRYDEARHELEAALAKEEDLRTRFSLGVTLRRMRRFVEAGEIFDKVSAIDKDFPGLSLERGLLFEETGQSDRALQAYQQALEKAPNDVDLKLHVGSTQVRAGHARDAEKLLAEVRNARPNSAEANHFLGRALLVKGENLAEAMRYLELAANLDGNRAEYFLYVGWAANELGQVNKARPALNKALELDHELADAYWQRGILLQNQGQTEDALRDLNTALEKRPSRFEAWATIALCDQAMQKWLEADRAWRLAIAGNDQQPEWHYRLGKLLNDHGNKAQVLPELQKAVDLATLPGQPHYAWLWDAYFLLAEALHRSPANKAKAIEAYQRVLELAPSGIIYRQDAEKALASLGVRVTH
jgi:tetratricopeptide (TPR) repeat protein